MKTEKVIKNVLDQFIGTQLNIDSEVARALLAKQIAAALRDEKWESVFGDTEYTEFRYQDE